MKTRIVPIFVPHLGCPQDCIFCNQRAISGQVTPMTEKLAFKLLSEAKDTIGDDFEVAFFGGSFTAIPKQEQDALLDIALKFTDNIRISTRPDYINEEILTRLKSKSVKTIELGIQSLDDEVLAYSKRGHTAYDATKAMSLIKSFGFTLGVQIMLGLPKDTKETLFKTVDTIISLKPDLARIYPIVVIGDTELYELYKNGKYQPLVVESAVELATEVLIKLRENNINVIRVGLNPSEDLSSGQAIAGAYHPAFGQLVLSKIYLKAMLSLLNCEQNKEVVFAVSKGETSTAIGNNRINKAYLYEKYKIKLKIIEEDLPKGEIRRLK